eukprot:TCALIF_12698-PA protein Name:"Protein of unknown function" AED:0.42 eAED:0.42 QI:0/0.5/0/0.66/1/1/3/0/465
MSTVLNVFKILGGFPFEVDAKDGGLRSNPRVWLFCFVRNIITVLLMAMVLVILEMDGRKFVVMFDNFLDLGMTVTHLVCALLLFIPNLIGLFGALWNYIGFGEKYNSLSAKMCTLYSRSLRTGPLTSMTSLNIRHILLKFGLAFLSALIASFCIYRLYPHDVPQFQMVVGMVLLTLFLFEMFFPIISGSARFIVKQKIDIISNITISQADHVDSCLQPPPPPQFYNDPSSGSLQRSQNNSTSDDRDDHDDHEGVNRKISKISIYTMNMPALSPAFPLETIIHNGLFLCDTLEEMNLALGPLIFLEYFVSILTLVVGSFFSLLMVMAFLGESFKLISFLFGLYHFVLGLLALIRIADLVDAGQTLSNRVKILQSKLESLYIIRPDLFLDNGSHWRAFILVERLKDNCILRPIFAFALTRESTLSLMGLLITYIIVLIQFKFSEKSKYDLYAYTIKNDTGEAIGQET